MIQQPDLFPSIPSVRGMVRRNSRETSREAARSVLPGLSELQSKILVAFANIGPMTDETLEGIFSGYGFSTIRKRRSELFQAGLLVADGTEKNRRGISMTKWRLAS